MYIEFSLPSGGKAGSSAQYCRHFINVEVAAWAQKFDIQFRTKTVKYTHRIILNSAQEYTLFGMSFEPQFVKADKFRHWLTNWRFVEPLSIDKHK